LNLGLENAWSLELRPRLRSVISKIISLKLMQAILSTLPWWLMI